MAIGQISDIAELSCVAPDERYVDYPETNFMIQSKLIYRKRGVYQHKLIKDIEGQSPENARNILYDHMCFAEKHKKEQEVIIKNSLMAIE